jgi:lipid-A-disaccharide synthase
VAARLDFVPSGQPVAGRAVLTSSGTMSLACALAGLPGAIVYRAHPATYWAGKMVVKIPYLGMANLILGRAAYPEFIQGSASPARLAEELRALQTPARVVQAEQDAADLRTALTADRAGSVAERVLALIESAK